MKDELAIYLNSSFSPTSNCFQSLKIAAQQTNKQTNNNANTASTFSKQDAGKDNRVRKAQRVRGIYVHHHLKYSSPLWPVTISENDVPEFLNKSLCKIWINVFSTSRRTIALSSSFNYITIRTSSHYKPLLTHENGFPYKLAS